MRYTNELSENDLDRQKIWTVKRKCIAYEIHALYLNGVTDAVNVQRIYSCATYTFIHPFSLPILVA